MTKIEKYPFKQVGRGFREYQMESWGDLVEFLSNDILPFNRYVWRGQRDPSWKLEPTIRRLSKDISEPDIEIQVLEKFQQAIRGRRGPNPTQFKDENELWALGQHHGLATPLLDWSTSPFVAAFFAYSEPYPSLPGFQNDLAEEIRQSQPKYRAIYALHSGLVEQWSKADLKVEHLAPFLAAQNTKPELKVYTPPEIKPAVEIVRPQSDENQRLISQGGLFTRTYGPQTIEEWIISRHPAKQRGNSLLKILVPDSDRVKALTLLNRMNINPLSLFPDLIGASMYSNLHAEIPNY